MSTLVSEVESLEEFQSKIDVIIGDINTNKPKLMHLLVIQVLNDGTHTGNMVGDPVVVGELALAAAEIFLQPAASDQAEEFQASEPKRIMLLN